MNLKKIAVLKNIFLYGIGDFIVTGVSGFLLVPYYVKQLTNAEFGSYSVINTNTIVFTYLVQFGIISGFSRVYYLHKKKGSEIKYFNGIISFHLIYAVFLTSIVFLFQNQIIHWLSPSIENRFYVYGSFIISLASFIPALYSIRFRLEDKANLFIIFQIITVAILLINVFLFLGWLEMRLHGLILAMVISATIMWLYFSISIAPTFKFSINLAALTETFKISLPIFIGYLAFFLVNKFSIILLQRYVSLKEIGIFSLAQQLAQIPVLASIAIGKAIQPIFFNSAKENLSVIYKRYDSSYKRIMFCLCCILIIFSNEIIHLFADNTYAKSASIFCILVVANLFYTSILLQNTILQYYFKSKYLMISVLVGSAVSLVLNYALIPAYKIEGAAIAILSAFATMAVLNIIFSNTLIKKAISVRQNIDFLLVTVFLALSIGISMSYVFHVPFVLKIALAAITVFFMIKNIKFKIQ